MRSFDPNEPGLPVSLFEHLTGEQLAHALFLRREKILRARLNPLLYGFELGIWKKADQVRADLREKFPQGVITELDLGGNRSSKSVRGCKRVVQDCVANPGHRWWLCDATESMSRANQMRYVFNFLPPEWKKDMRSRSCKIRYSIADGFAENIVVFPNQSEITFKFYSMKVTDLPGPELDGCYCFIAGTKVSCPRTDKPVEDIRAGELVKVRDGYGKVVATGTRTMPVGRVKFSNGQELIGTAEHLVLTSNGWTRLDKLQIGDRVCVIDACDSKEKCSTRMEADTFSIEEQDDSNELIESTYIGRCGKRPMELCLSDTMFITKTGIFLTTPLKTSHVSHAPITCDTILKTGEDFHVQSGKKKDGLRFPAQTAENLLIEGRKRTDIRPVNSAVQNEREKNRRSRDSVLCAEKHSGAIEGTFAVSVVSTWEADGNQKVYNLKVAGRPEYFANGILTHNCDELVPFDWIEILKYRLVNRNGILHLTFTPEAGWTDTVQYYLEGATTLEETEAELLPLYDGKGNVAGHRKVPRVQQCREETARIVYFHSKDNPYGNYPGLKQELKTKSPEVVLLRAYGVVDKAHAVAFPRFSRKVHVISTEQWGEIQKKCQNLERYQIVDPCSGRNWFMGWVGCPAVNKWIVYREWPSHGHRGSFIDEIGDPGAWTVQGSRADGAKGPAQKTFGFSLKRYANEIMGIEKGEEIRERWIDSSYSKSPTVEHEGVTTLIEQLVDQGLFFRASVRGKGRIIGPENNDGSVDMINDALYYDPHVPIGEFSSELGAINEPKLLIVETCPNIIYSLQHWTGTDGQTGASKDPVDLLRMMFLSSVGFQGKEMYVWTGGRAA